MYIVGKMPLGYLPTVKGGTDDLVIRNFLAFGTMMLGALSLAAPALAVCDESQVENFVPDTRYQINGGEVYDTETDLTWQRCSLGQTWTEGKGCTGTVGWFSLDQAKAQASGEWRVPTREELITLVSLACTPAVNPKAFPNMDETKLWYWSSSESGETTSYLVYLKDNSFYGADRTAEHPARLVKQGK